MLLIRDLLLTPKHKQIEGERLEKDIPQHQSPKETQCNHTNARQNRVKVKNFCKRQRMKLYTNRRRHKNYYKHTSNNRDPRQMEQALTELNAEIGNLAILVRDLSNPLLIMVRTFTKKMNKSLNNTLKQLQSTSQEQVHMAHSQVEDMQAIRQFSIYMQRMKLYYMSSNYKVNEVGNQ